MQAIPTVLADEFPAVIAGLEAYLLNQDYPVVTIVGVAHTAQELFCQLEQVKPALLIVDYRFGGHLTTQLLEMVRQMITNVNVIIYASDRSTVAREALAHPNVRKLVFKSEPLQRLTNAIHELNHNGKHRNFKTDAEIKHNKSTPAAMEEKQDFHLTNREIQILLLLAQAMSNKEIAKQLFISDQTVSVHRKNIMRKMGVSNAAGLIRKALDLQLIT